MVIVKNTADYDSSYENLALSIYEAMTFITLVLVGRVLPGQPKYKQITKPFDKQQAT